MLNGFGNYLNQLRSGNAKVYGETAFNIVSLVVGGAEIKSAVSIAKASEVESVFSKIGVFTKALGKASLENGKSLLTMPGRAAENIGNKLTDIRELLGGKGLNYAFAHAGEGRSVLNVVGKSADDLPKNGVRNNFSKVVGESGDVKKAQKALQDALDKAPKAEYLPGKNPDDILRIKPDFEAGVLRPKPTKYLDPNYIVAHKELFENGVTRFNATDEWINKTGYLGRTDISLVQQGEFVFPRDYADKMVNASGRNPRELERLLGLPDNFLGNTPIRADVAFEDIKHLRIPTGNEAGAMYNLDWRPGGNTYPGGIPEAVIDPVESDKVKVSSLFGGK